MPAQKQTTDFRQAFSSYDFTETSHVLHVLVL